MPDNSFADAQGKQPTNEQLVQASLAGDSSAINTLLERYFAPLKFFLAKISWFKDTEFFEEIIHDAVLLVLKAIKTGRFKPDSAASFKTYLFETAKNICWNENKKRATQYKPASQVFPKEPTGIPDDIMCLRDTDVSDFDYLRLKLKKALPSLSKKEQRFLELLIDEGKSYKEILLDPMFSKHKLDYLMRMLYIIKEKIRKMGGEL